MVKTLLISTVLNLQVLYPNADVCNTALETVMAQDPKAICIPAGENADEVKFAKIMDMFQNFINQNRKITVDKTDQ
jgi:hypothetical protein